MSIEINLTGQSEINVHVAAPSTIQVQLQDVSLINVVGEKYEGDYEVTPSTYNDKVMATQNMVMSKDVTIRKIPQFEVSNTADGKTLIIGESTMANQYVTRSSLVPKLSLTLLRTTSLLISWLRVLRPMTNLAHLSLVPVRKMLIPAMQLPLLQKF